MLTLFEGVASGAADGYARMAERPGGDAAAPRAGLRERVRERPQRVQGAHADGQRRRRSRGRPQAAGRAAGQRHRVGRAAGLALAADRARRALGGDGHGAGGRGGAGRRRRDADPPRRRGLGRRASAPAAPVPVRRAPPVPDGGGRGRGAGAAVRRGARCCSAAPATRERGPASGGADRGGDRRAGCSATRSRARLERGGSRPRPVGVPYLTELARRRARRALDTWCSSGTQPPVGFFAYPGQPSLLADPATTVTAARVGGGGRAGGARGAGGRRSGAPARGAGGAARARRAADRRRARPRTR